MPDNVNTLAAIVTNYNYQDFVCTAIDSVLAQQRVPEQIIVIDDGSSDGSEKLLQEKYGNNASVQLLFGRHGSMIASFDRAMPLVDADVACFLDADDYCAPAYLQRFGWGYDSQPEIDAVISDLLKFGH